MRGIETLGARFLVGGCSASEGERRRSRLPWWRLASCWEVGEREADLGEVRGQGHVKRALEVAAAGGHNLLLLGPPGAGKTMLARRLPGILPPLTLQEAVEATRIHSVAGLLAPGEPLLRTVPFEPPTIRSATQAWWVGEGSPGPGR